MLEYLVDIMHGGTKQESNQSNFQDSATEVALKAQLCKSITFDPPNL